MSWELNLEKKALEICNEQYIIGIVVQFLNTSNTGILKFMCNEHVQ